MAPDLRSDLKIFRMTVVILTPVICYPPRLSPPHTAAAAMLTWKPIMLRSLAWTGVLSLIKRRM